MATLLDVIATLDAIPEADRYAVSPTIFARKPWNSHSLALVLDEYAINGVAVLWMALDQPTTITAR